MKLHPKPDPKLTSNDNTETLASIEGQLSVIFDEERESAKQTIEWVRLMEFIHAVLEAKDAAAANLKPSPFCHQQLPITQGVAICGRPAEGSSERCQIHRISDSWKIQDDMIPTGTSDTSKVYCRHSYPDGTFCCDVQEPSSFFCKRHQPKPIIPIRNEPAPSKPVILTPAPGGACHHLFRDGSYSCCQPVNIGTDFCAYHTPVVPPPKMG